MLQRMSLLRFSNRIIQRRAFQKLATAEISPKINRLPTADWYRGNFEMCETREEDTRRTQSELTKRRWGNVPGTKERRERLDLRIPRETGGNECLEGRRHFELSLHHRQNQIAVDTRGNYHADRCHVVLVVQFRKSFSVIFVLSNVPSESWIRRRNFKSPARLSSRDHKPTHSASRLSNFPFIRAYFDLFAKPWPARLRESNLLI